MTSEEFRELVLVAGGNRERALQFLMHECLAAGLDSGRPNAAVKVEVPSYDLILMIARNPRPESPFAVWRFELDETPVGHTDAHDLLSACRTVYDHVGHSKELKDMVKAWHVSQWKKRGA